MAGLSLTLIWFSEALEAQWQAPAYTSAFRRGAVIAAQPRQASSDDECQQQTVPAASDASRSAAVRVVAMVDALAEVVIANVDELGRIDAVAGDGDHGMGMERGVRAARESAHQYRRWAQAQAPFCNRPPTRGQITLAALPARFGALS